MAARKAKDNGERYIVLLEKLGRMKPGIHYRRVYYSESKAFVPTGSRGMAHDIPKSVIFDTLVKAQTYQAGKGNRVWVVDSTARQGPVEVYEAFVKDTHSFVWSGQPAWYRLIHRVGAKEPTKDPGFQRTKVFTEKAKAFRYAGVLVANDIKRTEQESRRVYRKLRKLSTLSKRLRS